MVRASASCCWLLLLLGTVGCPSSPPAPNPPTASTASGDQPQVKDPASARPADRVADARLKGNDGDYPGAMRLLREHLIANPDDPKALGVAADLAMRASDLPTAVEYLDRLVEAKRDAPIALLDQLAQLWMRVGQPYESVRVLEESIERFPTAAEPRFDLAGLAAMLGLEGPTIQSLVWLAQHNQGHQEGLVMLANPARLEPDVEICEDALAKAPKDLRPEYGLARMDAFAQRWDSAADRLERVVETHPEFVAASALLGRSLVELDDAPRLEAWRSGAPTSITESSVYWDAAGRWALRQNEPEAAAKAFWYAVRIDGANDDRTLVSLATTLARIGRAEASQRAETRANQIAALRDATKTFFERGSRSQAAALRVARQMLTLGRTWEAEGWARWALQLREEPLADARQQYAEIRKTLTPQTPWQDPRGMVAASMDLSDLPDIAWKADTQDVSPVLADVQSKDRIRMEELAEQLGLTHTCELAAETENEGMWIYHSVGGGAAVLDFDLDGWPDLSLSMLDGQPLQSDSRPNQLYRNRQGSFVNISREARLNDGGFAQGIAVGDFNSDGFPDLFDANIGRNRLMINNGDGTFRDVSDRAGLTSNVWTSSAAIIDINGDSIADIWEVNYCAGPEPYENECLTSAGKTASCSPLKFRAEPDRIWAGRGDGSFTDVTEQWMPNHDAGRGLGLIAGELDQRPGMDVYVANDMTRNQLWSAAQGADGFALSDIATIAGVAVNGRSISQASMGMAAGDADNDGDIDFFVTHFSDDHNTYYEQVSPGLWQDRSYPVGLGRPSEPLLGFGTEWVDLDNSGSMELIIANGHVSDLRSKDIPYHMPAQIYRVASGKWEPVESDLLGNYFQQNHLGRALVTLDADRDGRVDCCITHIHEPVALLMNRSDPGSAAIGLSLVSRNGHRDAIGATILATVGDQQRRIAWTAGDGYMCSNQRRLSIGVGNHDSISEVNVIWADGKAEAFGNLKAGADYLLIEGSGVPFENGMHE